MDFDQKLNDLYLEWFNIINDSKVYNYKDFIPCLKYLQNHLKTIKIPDKNQKDYTAQIQEEILDILRFNMIKFGIDDFYNIILEHIILKQLFNLKSEPIEFKDILEERLSIMYQYYNDLPNLWILQNYPLIVKFRKYF